MYSKKDSISGVQDFKLADDNLFILKSGYLHLFQNLTDKWISVDEAGEIIYAGEYVICTKQEFTVFFDSLLGLTTVKLDKYHGVYQNSKSDYVLFDNFLNQNRTMTLYSLKRKIFLWNLDEKRGAKSYLDNNHFFVSAFRKDNVIKSIEIETGKVLWIYDTIALGTFLDGAVEKSFQVMQFCGVYKNTLVVTMNNGGILLLDNLSGQILEFFVDAQMRLNLNSVREESSIFYGFNHKTFIEIDVEKKKIIRKVNIEKILLVSIDSKILKFVNYSIVHDGLIYFIAGHDTISIFDPRSEKIIWKFKFEFEQKGTILKTESKSLQVNGNRLYVLDTFGDLHIFEKTN